MRQRIRFHPLTLPYYIFKQIWWTCADTLVFLSNCFSLQTYLYMFFWYKTSVFCIFRSIFHPPIMYDSIALSTIGVI